MKILFRADGNSEIGLGHVIRSCAIAEMLRNNFECEFYIRQPSEYLKQEIAKAGCKLVEMPIANSYEEEAETWARTLTGKEIVVLDGYNFKTSYQQSIKNRNCRLVCIDDIHAYHFVADVVINHAGGTSPSIYSAESNTQFFLGLKYSLLRKEFLAGRTKPSDPFTLLICLGGADPENDTQKVLEKVANAGFKCVKVLVGAGYRHKEDLERYLNSIRTQFALYQNIDAAQVALLMQSCSHAVLSPSSIAYEYMSFSGIVYLYQIADNQDQVKRYFIEKKMAFDFADFDKRDLIGREIIEIQKQYFDNKSASRVLKIFKNIALIQSACIRKAIEADISITYRWANDSLARQMSFKTDQITEKEHSDWFLKKLNDAHSHYYILEINGVALAQIRFDYKERFYLLSYFIDEAFRGKGLGSFLMSEGIRQLKADKMQETNTIVGYVKKENTASCLSFEKMQFLREQASDYNDSFKYTLDI